VTDDDQPPPPNPAIQPPAPWQRPAPREMPTRVAVRIAIAFLSADLVAAGIVLIATGISPTVGVIMIGAGIVALSTTMESIWWRS